MGQYSAYSIGQYIYNENIVHDFRSRLGSVGVHSIQANIDFGSANQTRLTGIYLTNSRQPGMTVALGRYTKTKKQKGGGGGGGEGSGMGRRVGGRREREPMGLREGAHWVT